MGRVAIVTDSNSGITQQMAKQMGINVIPMPFTVDDDEYFEDINLTQEDFYDKLCEGSEISTSQPSAGAVLELWDNLLKEYDGVVYIPMSSGLSGSCATSIALSDDYDGKVQVINNQRISVTQKQSVIDAMKLADEGMTAVQIKEKLEQEKLEASIYITVDTLKYLKKGGRVTAAGAAIGTVLNIKPVLTIQGEKLDAFSKSRGMKLARKVMIDAIVKDIDDRFADSRNDKTLKLWAVHTMNEEAAIELQKELKDIYPELEIGVDRLALSVACHIGPGSLAIACAKSL